MADWSVLIASGSAVLNVAQWIQGDRSVQRLGARQPQLEGIKALLTQLNYTCNDAEQKGDTRKPDAMARFISDVASQAKGIEHQVDIMLGTLRLVPAKPQSRFRRIMGYIFPATRI